MKHYNLVEFLSNLNVNPSQHKRKVPRTNVKPPNSRLSGNGSGQMTNKIYSVHTLKVF